MIPNTWWGRFKQKIKQGTSTAASKVKAGAGNFGNRIKSFFGGKDKDTSDPMWEQIKQDTSIEKSLEKSEGRFFGNLYEMFFGRHASSTAGQQRAENEKDREFQDEQADKQMEFQKDMSNTQYQRGMADMEAAGINPMFALGAGGASAPSGAAGQGGARATQQDTMVKDMLKLVGNVMMMSMMQTNQAAKIAANKELAMNKLGTQEKLALNKLALNQQIADDRSMNSAYARSFKERQFSFDKKYHRKYRTPGELEKWFNR